MDRKLDTGSIVGIAIGGLSVLLLLAVLLLCCLKKKKGKAIVLLKGKSTNGGKKPEDFGSGVQEPEKNKLVFFENSSYNFDLEDLLRASAEVLGKGSFGTSYKAVLDEETMVVVKRMREVVGIGKKEFEQQMELIGRIERHPNVLPLLAYYASKDEKLLVSEYVPCGSLSAVLHGNRGIGRTTLDWESRANITLGVARGLCHIHSVDNSKFIHGNIKSSNVLLVQNLTPSISDLGLSPLLNLPSPKSRGAGYRAPEVIETQKLTQESDVYSYGVLLLEILTGKDPLPSHGRIETVDLPRWVRSVVREEWTAEVFDPDLMKYQNVEEEMLQMLQIALSCVAKVPKMRPAMGEVVRMIEDLRSPESENRYSSEDVRLKNSVSQTP